MTAQAALKALQAEHGWYIPDLSRLSGVHHNTIRRVIHGQNPSKLTLMALRTLPGFAALFDDRKAAK